jgi:AraC-like DNA-binding protein
MLSQARQAQPVHLSVSPLQEPSPQLRRINELNMVLPLQPLAGSVVCADIVQWPYPQVGILSARLQGLRQGTHLGPAVRSGLDDELYLRIVLAGLSVAARRTDALTLRSGDAVLMSAPDGFTLTHPGHVDLLGLRLSRSVLEKCVHDIDGALMRRIPCDTPALALLSRYVQIALDASVPTNDNLRRLVADHVYELASASLAGGGSDPGEGRGIRAARVRAIKADILERLGDWKLCAATVADRHHISQRYVHKLFAGEGTSFSDFVLRERLELVRRMLTDARFDRDAISALAFRSGFGDLSHFNRTFRQRYGATPSDVRRSRAAQGCPE